MNDNLKLRQRRRGISLAALAIGAAFLASACGGQQPQAEGVASLGDTPSPSSSAQSNNAGNGDGLAYSQCMRENGVKEFPDPSGDGKLTLRSEPGGGLDPNSETFKKAEDACKDLRPEPSEGEKANMKEAALKYAQCMRENGIKSFPDPGPNGEVMIRMKKGTEMDPQSPKFKAAEEACKDLRPGGKQGAGPSTNEESK